MTDVDAMARKVGSLEKFRTRVESAIAFVEGLQAAGFRPPTAAGEVVNLTEDQKNQVRDQFAEIIKPISDAIDVKLNSFDDRLQQLEGGGGAGSAADISQRLAALEDGKTESDEEMRRRDRLDEMLTWFDANKEGLELLLSLDGDVDQPNPQTGSGTGIADGNPQTGASTASGTAAGATETASGAGSAPSGTEGSGTADGTHAGSFKELSQAADSDPSVRAEAAVAEPVAKS